jgi:hypothetical protein
MLEEHQVITTQVIEDVVNKSSADRIPIRDLIDAMDGSGFGLAIMIFAFGITIPLPPPFPSIISMPLVVFSIQMIMGYSSPRLPKRFANLSVKRSVLAMLVSKSAPYIRKVERILKPRLSFMKTAFAERVIGVFILMFSSFILLPMPLSNFIPGVGILIISFGLIGKDGLVMLSGIMVGLAGLAISITAVFLGVEALHYLKNLFF